MPKNSYFCRRKKKIEDYEFVKVRLDGGVARMTLSRPEHNLLNEAMLRELAEGIEHVGSREDIKIILLDSACKVFCGGIRSANTLRSVFSRCSTLFTPLLQPWWTSQSRSFASSTDPRSAAERNFRLRRPGHRHPQGALCTARNHHRHVSAARFDHSSLPGGAQSCSELVLTGEPVTAERALDLGLVNRLVPEAQLETTVKDLLARMTGHSGAVLTMAKKAILGGMGMSLRDGLKHSMGIFLNELYRLEDSQEGLHALVEKRKPNWKNR